MAAWKIVLEFLVLTPLATILFLCGYHWGRRRQKTDAKEYTIYLQRDNIATGTANMLEMNDPLFFVMEGNVDHKKAEIPSSWR